MASTPTYFANNPPINGSDIIPPNVFYFVPNSGNSVSATVKLWSGANGTGSGTGVATTLTAFIRSITGASDLNPISGNFNSVTSTSAADSNGTNVLACGGRISNSSGFGSLGMSVTYTGRVANLMKLRIGGAWQNAPGGTAVNFRQGSGWKSAPQGSVNIHINGSWHAAPGF